MDNRVRVWFTNDDIAYLHGTMNDNGTIVLDSGFTLDTSECFFAPIESTGSRMKARDEQ